MTGLALAAAVVLAFKSDKPERAAPHTGGARPPRRKAAAPALATSTASAKLSQPAGPISPWRMPFSCWKQAVINTYNEIANDRLLAVAAGVVFYALLAIFPAITAFVSFYGLFASYSTINEHISLLSYVLPAGGLDIVQEQIGRIIARDGKLGWGFALGLVMALWSANAGVKAMIDALNVAEGVPEKRGFVWLNVVSLTFTLGVMVFLLLSVGAVVAFPLVMAALGLTALTGPLVWLIRWPVLLGVVMLGLAVLYRFGPNADKRHWHWISPGSLFAAVSWLASSAALSFYLSNFADYNATYGSLGAAIGLMMWMWISVTVVLIGAELNSEIRKLTRGGAPDAAVNQGLAPQ